MTLEKGKRYCLWCGAVFRETRNREIYCSRKCEREAERKNCEKNTVPPPGKLLQPEVRICKRCGTPFVTDHEGRRYCSDRCRYGNVQKVLQEGQMSGS